MPLISSLVHLSGDVLTPGGIIILPRSPFSEPSYLTTRCFSLSYQRETICPECRIRAKRQQSLHDLPGSALLGVLAEGLSCGPGHTYMSTVEAAVPLGPSPSVGNGSLKPTSPCRYISTLLKENLSVFWPHLINTQFFFFLVSSSLGNGRFIG